MNSKPLTKNEVIKLLNNFIGINLEKEFISSLDLSNFSVNTFKVSSRIAAGDDKRIVLN